MHVFMSLSIGFPSLMTAFAMFAVFEKAGRRKGGKGFLFKHYLLMKQNLVKKNQHRGADFFVIYMLSTFYPIQNTYKADNNPKKLAQ